MRPGCGSGEPFVGERVQRAQGFRLGKRVERGLGQTEIVKRRDLDVERRPFHQRHRVADLLDQLRFVRGCQLASRRVRLQQQFAPEDLGSLRGPEGLSRNSLRDCFPVVAMRP